MTRRQRLSLHLTPLLDLLLIVIFAQFIEVEDRQQGVERAASATTVQRDRLNLQVAQLQLTQQVLAGQVDAERLRNQTMAGQLEQSESELAHRELQLQHLAEQQVLLGQLMEELYDVPGEEIEQAIHGTNNLDVPRRSPEQVEELRVRFRELARQSPQEMIRHVLEYHEIRKRVDVWTLHLSPQGGLTFDAGTDIHELGVRTDSTPFDDRIFAIYKSLPEPKGLVIVALSYDYEASIDDLRLVRQRLFPLIERMQQSAGARTRFELADLGMLTQD